MKKLIYILLLGFSLFMNLSFAQQTIGGFTVNFGNSGTLYNVRQYGLTGDGTTDDRNALNVLLNTTAPTGASIYFPPGTYSLGSGISISDKYFYFIGDFATIKVGGNFTAFTFTSSSNVTLLAARNCFNGLKFLGTSTGASQTAITFSTDASEFTVNNCIFENLGGTGIITYITNSASGAGGLISQCKFLNNNIGIDGQLAGEYVAVNNNYFLGNTQAIQSIAGNWIVSNNNINRGSAGIKWAAGSNDGHGTIISNNINHMSGFSLDIGGLANGMTISDNHIYSGNVSIKTSTGIVISGGEYDATANTFSNNVGLCFNNVTFIGTSGAVTLTGNAPVYNNCKDLQGQITSCPQATCSNTNQIRKVSFALNSQGLAQTFAASTSYYISPGYGSGSRSTANQIPYSIGKKCKLIGYTIVTNHNGTSPSQNNSTVYLRLNNTNDITLSNNILWNVSAFTPNYYSDFILNQDISTSDYWEIKLTTAAFATPPTTAWLIATLYFSEEY